MRPTPFIGRRSVIAGLAVVGAGAAGSGLARAASPLQPTPRQTAGPFYPVDWSGDADNDLVQVTGEAAQALGEVLHLQGRVLGADGAPLPAAAVEIWQCDANGVYRHPAGGSGTRKRDTGFQGRGRIVVDTSGRYSFRTIRPVAYPGRTPHIHVRVIRDGKRSLDTQMYVRGDPVTPGDFVIRQLSKAEFEAVTIKLEAADSIEPGAKTAIFDIVLA